MKKIISLILSVLLIFGCCTAAFSAEEQAEEASFKYVALGDSVSAGFGLSEASQMMDPTMILTQELIDNPIEGAYPAVFGRYLAQMADGKNISAKATNLSLCGYTSEDIAALITTPGYVSPVMHDGLDAFIGEGASAPLANYHDIMMPYLEEADMVSILIGANDIMVNGMLELSNSDNVIVLAFVTTMSMTMLGYSFDEAIAMGSEVIRSYEGEITVSMISEAINIVTAFYNNIGTYVDAVSVHVREIIDEIRDINSDVEIVVLNYFNPYGNSLEYNGQRYDFASVSGRLIFQLMFNAMMGNPRDFKTILADELSYPLQYMTLGKINDQAINLLNVSLQEIAVEKDCAFVDIYDISNDQSLDPHPSAEQHVEIADRMMAVLGDHIADVFEEMSPSDLPLLGDADCDGSVTIIDATVIQFYMAEVEAEVFDEARADADLDGSVTVLDATSVQRWLNGMYEDSGIGKPIA